jgi:hypothetical protein
MRVSCSITAGVPDEVSIWDRGRMENTAWPAHGRAADREEGGERMAEAPAKRPECPPNYLKIDERGRVIPPTPEERRERSRRLKELIAQDKELTPEELAAELDFLRQIDEDRAARGERLLYEEVLLTWHSSPCSIPVRSGCWRLWVFTAQVANAAGGWMIWMRRMRSSSPRM